MHIPVYAQADVVNDGRRSSSELVAPDGKSSSTGYMIENGDVGPLAQTSDSLIRS